MVAFRIPAQNGRPSWLARAAQSTGPLVRVVKNHLAKENVMTDTTSIPLNKLVLWSGNVRKTAGSDTGLLMRSVIGTAPSMFGPSAISVAVALSTLVLPCAGTDAPMTTAAAVLPVLRKNPGASDLRRSILDRLA
jgi:hypothetical protein